MICYLDRTFCVRWPADDCFCPPHRHLTPEMRAHAERIGLRIATADLCKGKQPAPPHPASEDQPRKD